MNDKSIAYFLLRLALGVNMLIHGAGRLLGGYTKFIDDTKALFAATALPAVSVEMFATAVPWFEAILGLLLILGLGTRYAAIVGALLMINLIFGMSLLQKWDIVGLQMTYVLFYFLILFLSEWNEFSLDALMTSKRSPKRRK